MSISQEKGHVFTEKASVSTEQASVCPEQASISTEHVCISTEKPDFYGEATCLYEEEVTLVGHRINVSDVSDEMYLIFPLQSKLVGIVSRERKVYAAAK